MQQPETEQSTKGLQVVTSIVLNWNDFDATRNCVRSLLEEPQKGHFVVIVDNASVDGSYERLRAEFSHLPVLQSGGNLGFARGCNVGIRYALENQDPDFVFLLNNDAILARGSLAAGIARASRPEAGTVGLVGGKILYQSNKKKIWSAGGRISLLRAQAVSRGGGHQDVGQYDEALQVTFVTGAMMLITREMLRRVGPLPEEYFFGQEEWDYSVAANRAGLSLWYEPKMQSYHDGDGSHRNHDPKFIYNSYRNKLIFAKKYINPVLFPLWYFSFAYVYRHLLAERHLFRLHAGRSEGRQMKYALDCAIRDYRLRPKSPISEGDLTQFAIEASDRHDIS